MVVNAGQEVAIDELHDLFLLDPAIAHLNHGGFGASPRPVLEAREHWMREIERHPSAWLSRSHGYDEAMGTVRASIADAFAASVDDVALCRNTTDGINAAALSIALQPGDEVLTTDHEYAALDHVWEHRCQATGARLVRRQLPLDDPTPDALFDAVWSGASDRTRVVYFSHVTSETSILMPTDALCRAARAHGAISVVDGAHGPAQLDLDLGEVSADMYAASFHKWVCGPRGTGFLHVRSHLHDTARGSLISHGDVPGASFQERMTWQGTVDVGAFLSVPTAIGLVTSPAWIRSRSRCRELASAAADTIANRFELGLTQTRGPQSTTQMVSVPIPLCDAEATRRTIFHRHGVDVPIRTRDGRSYVRVSIQLYNTTYDIERLLAALEAELA